MKKFVLPAILFLIVVGATFALNYRLEAEKVDRRQTLCKQDQKQWHALHDLIDESAKPGPQGTAIDNLVIPPGTDPQTIDILRQLSTFNNPPPPDYLDRFYKVLGPEPSC